MSEVPTLYDWAGGMPGLLNLTRVFYAKVPHDPILEPVFRDMPDDHPVHVAEFIGEVLGGPKEYSTHRGGHIGMIRRHLDRHLTELQRRRWVDLLLDSADEAGLPQDPEFRSAFVGYVEWGTRLAVLNSQAGVAVPANPGPMPEWNWGPPGGPYRPPAEGGD